MPLFISSIIVFSAMSLAKLVDKFFIHSLGR